MRRWIGWLAAGALLAGPASAATLDRVRQENTLRCGAAERAGFADAGENGQVTGLAVDLCRALTIAVLGPAGQTAFRLYSTDADYADAGNGRDEVAFVTADAVTEHRLAARLAPGPVVFVAELTVLAHPGVDSLAGHTVCLMNGSSAHQAVEAWAAHASIAFVRQGFQEDGEMHDAFDAGRCDAMAGEATELAELRAGSRARRADRILPPLAVMPVMAATSVQDGGWTGLVGWAIAALVQSETTPSPWRSDPPALTLAGLRPGWATEVMASVGSYPDMVQRKFPAGLPARANASWPAGLLLPGGPR